MKEKIIPKLLKEYLEKRSLGNIPKNSVTFREIERSFYAAISAFIIMMGENEPNKLSDIVGNTCEECSQYWKNEQTMYM